MRNQVSIPSILISFILLAMLACTLQQPSGMATLSPTEEQEIQATLALPTEAPTAAPEEAVNTPAPPSAQTILAAGTKISYASSGDAACTVESPLTLVLPGDGTATLTTTGASIIDHSNCTAGSSQETWIVTGLVNEAEQRVNFESCNYGNFSASGSMSFDGGSLAGEVSCTNKDGVKFVSLSAQGR